MRVFAILLLAVSPVWSEPIRQPRELQPGDKYRLAFMTSSSRDATSTDIADYDAFVQGVADTAPDVGSWGLTWQVLGSTNLVDACAHTSTQPLIHENSSTPVINESVPIFQLDGSLVAGSYWILWNPLDNASDDGYEVTELGTRLPTTIPDQLEHVVWTGTGMSGVADGPLGSTVVTAGVANSVAPHWFTEHGLRNTESHHLYAISEVLTAVPEPSGLRMLLSGLLIFAFRRAWRPQTARRAA